MAKKAKAAGPTLVERQAYYDKLMAHDWDYRYSESRSVFERGSRTEDELKAARDSGGPAFVKLYNAVEKYKADRSRPKPKRPE